MSLTSLVPVVPPPPPPRPPYAPPPPAVGALQRVGAVAFDAKSAINLGTSPAGAPRAPPAFLCSCRGTKPPCSHCRLRSFSADDSSTATPVNIAALQAANTTTLLNGSPRTSTTVSPFYVPPNSIHSLFSAAHRMALPHRSSAAAPFPQSAPFAIHTQRQAHVKHARAASPQMSELFTVVKPSSGVGVGVGAPVSAIPSRPKIKNLNDIFVPSNMLTQNSPSLSFVPAPPRGLGSPLSTHFILSKPKLHHPSASMSAPLPIPPKLPQASVSTPLPPMHLPPVPGSVISNLPLPPPKSKLNLMSGVNSNSAPVKSQATKEETPRKVNATTSLPMPVKNSMGSSAAASGVVTSATAAMGAVKSSAVTHVATNPSVALLPPTPALPLPPPVSTTATAAAPAGLPTLPPHALRLPPALTASASSAITLQSTSSSSTLPPLPTSNASPGSVPTTSTLPSTSMVALPAPLKLNESYATASTLMPHSVPPLSGLTLATSVVSPSSGSFSTPLALSTSSSGTSHALPPLFLPLPLSLTHAVGTSSTENATNTRFFSPSAIRQPPPPPPPPPPTASASQIKQEEKSDSDEDGDEQMPKVPDEETIGARLALRKRRRSGGDSSDDDDSAGASVEVKSTTENHNGTPAPAPKVAIIGKPILCRGRSDSPPRASAAVAKHPTVTTTVAATGIKLSPRPLPMKKRRRLSAAVANGAAGGARKQHDSAASRPIVGRTVDPQSPAAMASRVGSLALPPPLSLSAVASHLQNSRAAAAAAVSRPHPSRSGSLVATGGRSTVSPVGGSAAGKSKLSPPTHPQMQVPTRGSSSRSSSSSRSHRTSPVSTPQHPASTSQRRLSTSQRPSSSAQRPPSSSRRPSAHQDEDDAESMSTAAEHNNDTDMDSASASPTAAMSDNSNSGGGTAPAASTLASGGMLMSVDALLSAAASLSK